MAICANLCFKYQICVTFHFWDTDGGILKTGQTETPKLGFNKFYDCKHLCLFEPICAPKFVSLSASITLNFNNDLKILEKSEKCDKIP